MALKSERAAKVRRPANFKTFTRLMYRNAKLYASAFSLVDIPHGRQLESYVVRGVLELTVERFNVKAVVRNIRECRYDPLTDDTDPGQPTVAHPLPPLTYSFPTRWDMDAGRLIRHQPLPDGALAPPQRVLIKIILEDPLVGFLPGVPAVTAKDQESASVLANLSTSMNVARFWCLFDGGTAPQVIAGFNIALLITDRSNPIFVLPIIVDPKVPNRG